MSVFRGHTQEEKTIRGVKMSGEVLYVSVIDLTDPIELSSDDVVYADR